MGGWASFSYKLSKHFARTGTFSRGSFFISSPQGGSHISKQVSPLRHELIRRLAGVGTLAPVDHRLPALFHPVL